MIPVYTATLGDNGKLIEQVAKMYLKIGDKICDPTFGKGVFWKRLPMDLFKFFPSDIKTCKDHPYDFRELPYEDAFFDCVVFDPPYTHDPGQLLVNPNYMNKETTKGFNHADTTSLYRHGMEEARRILKIGGYLWVKCKDEVESSIQRWSHIELLLLGHSLGYYARDLFLLVPNRLPPIQHKKQNHARKNHSYLWVFEKIKSKHKGFQIQQLDIKKGF